MRRFEVGTAVAFIVLAAVAMFDSRRGALFGATRDPGGIGSGFYPFWSAAVMAVAALVIVVRAMAVRPEVERGEFLSRQGLRSVWVLAAPMFLAAVAMSWLGFYLTVGAYMGFFARLIGSYRWIWVSTIAVGVPLLTYLIFEQGFRMLLPKSVLYGYLLPI